MKRSIIALAAATILAACGGTAHAAPVAVYNPQNGAAAEEDLAVQGWLCAIIAVAALLASLWVV